MIDILKTIIAGALERLSQQIKTDLPPMLAAVAILIVAVAVARLARWLITRAFKGTEADRWLRRSGVSAMIDRSGTLRASRLIGQSAYWGIVVVGALAALNVFGTQVTMRIAAGVMSLVPRLVAAGAIVLAGFWIGQYAGRSTLVWAVNEDLPSPRRLALVVRTLIVFGAIVIAAEAVDFAKGVFLAAFILILGGVVLTASLALGLGARDVVRRRLSEGASRDAIPEGERVEAGGRSLWNHL